MLTPGARRYLQLALLLLTYVVAGKLGLQLAFAFPSATPVWPATGLAFVALLRFGLGLWPAVFVGAFLVNITTAGTVLTSLGIAGGNMLEAVLGAWLVTRYAGGVDFVRSPERIFSFTLLAAMGSTMVSATIGTATLFAAGMVPPGQWGPIWLTWWLGDASGDLLIAPALLLWVRTPLTLPTPRRALEGIALFGGLIVVGLILFGVVAPLSYLGASLKFLTIPFLTWAAVRFGPREAATAILLLGAIAIWGTLGANGFGRSATNTTLLLLQAYMAVATVMTLMLAGAVAERRAAEERLTALSITDPLTGIANYRHLITSLAGEIERSERTGRPFAILFMDVDGLKAINDRYGHLAGSHALCEVAEVLRASARVVDTAARYGGDEFALLLPETTEEEANQVAKRLAERLAARGGTPPVTLSIGVAVHPRDGRTADALIGSADRQLYQVRSRERGTPATV